MLPMVSITNMLDGRLLTIVYKGLGVAMDTSYTAGKENTQPHS